MQNNRWSAFKRFWARELRGVWDSVMELCTLVGRWLYS